MKNKYVVGIDPGINGAIAFVGEDIRIYDIPTTKINDIRVVNSKELYNLFKQNTDDINYFNIEFVHSIRGDGIAGAFSFGRTYGMIIAILLLFDKEVNFIAPQTWKAKFGLTCQQKDLARTIVIRMYPYLEESLKRKMDIDRAEAILIASC